MLTVWIRSPTQITSVALANLVGSFGYQAKLEEDAADLALWLLPQDHRPVPPAPPLPTLLLLPGGEGETELRDIYAKGYRAVLHNYEDGEGLKRALAALEGSL